jgi:hypothetical protein
VSAFVSNGPSCARPLYRIRCGVFCISYSMWCISYSMWCVLGQLPQLRPVSWFVCGCVQLLGITRWSHGGHALSPTHIVCLHTIVCMAVAGCCATLLLPFFAQSCRPFSNCIASQNGIYEFLEDHLYNKIYGDDSIINNFQVGAVSMRVLRRNATLASACPRMRVCGMHVWPMTKQRRVELRCVALRCVALRCVADRRAEPIFPSILSMFYYSHQAEHPLALAWRQ